MKYFFLTIIFFSFFTAKVFAVDALYLYVGIQQDYKLSEDLKGKDLVFAGPYKRLTSLNYNKADGTLRFVPKRKGVGAINIKDKKGKILKKLTVNVRVTDLREVATEIQNLLRTVDGIEVKILNNRVVVDGEIVVPRDMRRIHDVVSEYEPRATSLVTLSPLAQSKVARFIEKEINNPNVTVRAVNMVFILEGFVKTKKEKARAQDIAQLYIPDQVVDKAVTAQKVKAFQRSPILNYIKVREEDQNNKKDDRGKLVQITVHYVELNKDYADNFRFNWAPGIDDGTKFSFYSTPGGLAKIGGMISGTISNFLPKLNWAKTFGFARVLHNASVITEEGQKATINANKKIPYLSSKGANGEQTTSTQDVGFKVELNPAITGPRGDSVKLSNINVTISNLVGSAGGQPITTERTLTTSIHVQNGLSAVLGGLVSNQMFSDYNRAPPGQSKNPIFSFLASKKFSRAQSQFVIFVTPTIKSSASSDVKRIKKRFKVSNIN